MITARMREAYDERIATHPEGYQEQWRQWEYFLCQGHDCLVAMAAVGLFLTPEEMGVVPGVRFQMGGDPIPEMEQHLNRLLTDRCVVRSRQHPVVMDPGEPGECHTNVSKLLINGEIDAIWTGYGLSKDGLWRQHSWGERSDGAIVETTEIREVYAGIRLNWVESFSFMMGELELVAFEEALTLEHAVSHPYEKVETL